MNGIGNRIRTLREKNNLTQLELADNLNITHQSVSKWEREESLPDVSLIVEIARIFAVSTDYILLGKDTERWYMDVKVTKNRPVKPLESLTIDELMTMFTVLVPDMSDKMKISLHEKGYLDFHYSYMWSEGRELMEQYWYSCSEAIINASKVATDFEEVYNQVEKSYKIPKPLFKSMFDELISIGKITKITHLLNE